MFVITSAPRAKQSGTNANLVRYKCNILLHDVRFDSGFARALEIFKRFFTCHSENEFSVTYLVGCKF